MIPGLLMVWLIIYVLLQSRPSRAPVWRVRAESVRQNPFRIEFVRDVRVTTRFARDWPVRVGDRRRVRKLERENNKRIGGTSG